jgi:hypothetical protein
MKKFSYFIILLLLTIVASFSVQAQNLDDLRQVPPKDALKVGTPPMLMEEIIIPQKTLDLKVSYWRNWTSFGINANQSSFSDNWNGGGVNSISVGMLFDHKSEYIKNDKSFVTQVSLKYGKVKNKEQSARKSNDRIFLDNKAALKFSKYWSFFASVALETQFDAGYSYSRNEFGDEVRSAPISNFMAPGYITESVGVEFNPDKTFSLRLGTGTARQTLILDNRLVFEDRPNFGVEAGKNFKNELAFQVVANLNRKIGKNLDLSSRYAFFANYEELENASHRLDATLAARVSRVINVSLSTVVWYDKNVVSEIQMSENLALGIMYRFPR